MIFVSTSLDFNGGTTFILRMCRELQEAGENPGVILLTEIFDNSLKENIEKYATLYTPNDIFYWYSKPTWKSPASIFTPIKAKKIDTIIEEHGPHFHAMGLFGLLFCNRCKINSNRIKTTVGVYHQNEFAYKDFEYYFSKTGQEIFRKTPAGNVLFFNEHSRDMYSRFFGKDYGESLLAPVGITIPPDEHIVKSPPQELTITSIGKLEAFKTYNEHTIKLLPKILKNYPTATYHIYGDGPEKNNLTSLTKKLNIENNVFFHGNIPYNGFKKALENTTVFIGSGTAIIEASALGIPSIIGIESISLPVTYGFFSQAQGYTYHEFDPQKQTAPIEKFILSLAGAENINNWKMESTACRNKSLDFSSAKTTAALNFIEKNYCQPLDADISSFRCLTSLALSFAKQKLLGHAGFSTRRHQGTI